MSNLVFLARAAAALGKLAIFMRHGAYLLSFNDITIAHISSRRATGSARKFTLQREKVTAPSNLVL
jgi:hypothetical protein